MLLLRDIETELSAAATGHAAQRLLDDTDTVDRLKASRARRFALIVLPPTIWLPTPKGTLPSRKQWDGMAPFTMNWANGTNIVIAEPGTPVQIAGTPSGFHRCLDAHQIVVGVDGISGITVIHQNPATPLPSHTTAGAMNSRAVRTELARLVEEGVAAKWRLWQYISERPWIRDAAAKAVRAVSAEMNQGRQMLGAEDIEWIVNHLEVHKNVPWQTIEDHADGKRPVDFIRDLKARLRRDATVLVRRRLGDPHNGPSVRRQVGEAVSVDNLADLLAVANRGRTACPLSYARVANALCPAAAPIVGELDHELVEACEADQPAESFAPSDGQDVDEYATILVSDAARCRAAAQEIEACTDDHGHVLANGFRSIDAAVLNVFATPSIIKSITAVGLGERSDAQVLASVMGAHSRWRSSRVSTASHLKAS
jgi:hypothetical protein